MGEDPIVRHQDEIPGTPCPCGISRRVLTRADRVVAGFHVTDLGDAKRHVHHRTVEIYAILEGEGVMELGSDVYPVKPGHVIYVPAGCPHRAMGRMRAHIVTIPPFDPDDEHLCDD
ncbi:MAG: cupin domain-containing protein [Armatimonadetes bacterium]|nr:cupin domain-containing protein [Armatimonadota bacterium]